MKKELLAFLLVFICIFTIRSQDTLSSATKEHYYSLGGKKWGIGVGPSGKTYSGIRLNFHDETYRTNGINLSLVNLPDYNETTITNGLHFSLAYLDITKLNGLGIAPLGMECEKVNGLFACGLFADIDKLNGIGFTALFNLSDQVNGLSIAGLDATSTNMNGVSLSAIVNITDEVANGVSISGIYAETEVNNGLLIGGVITNSEKTNGVQLGLLNFSRQMLGFQFGLLNKIDQNQKWCRIMPFVNFHLKKYIPRVDSIVHGDTVLVKKYELDNRTLKSVESYLNSDGKILKNGSFISYTPKGLITDETIYRKDTIFYYKRTNQTSRERRSDIYIRNDSCNKRIVIKGNDTVDITTNCKGKSRFLHLNKTRNTLLYYDTLANNRLNSVEVYNGKEIILKNSFNIKKRDTLSKYTKFQMAYGIDFFPFFTKNYDHKMESYFKKDTMVFVNYKNEIEGWAFKNDSTHVASRFFYYNYQINKIKRISTSGNESFTDSLFYPNGKLNQYTSDYLVTTFDKKGNIAEIENIDDVLPYRKVFKNQRLQLLEMVLPPAHRYEAIYYKNGQMKHEFIGSTYATYTEKYYRKDGTIKEERCFNEGIRYYYNKKGNFKKSKNNMHRPKFDLEG